MSEEIDLVEWELVVPPSEILAFHSVPVWEDIVHGRGEQWQSLLVERTSDEMAARKDVDAWVRFPPKAGTINCLGPLPIRQKGTDNRTALIFSERNGGKSVVSPF
jgi:hypothetical protein